MQRMGKSLIDAFHTFFIPEVMSMYAGLELYQESNFSKSSAIGLEQENSMSVALG